MEISLTHFIVSQVFINSILNCIYGSLIFILVITVQYQFPIRFRQDLPADWSGSGCSTTYHVLIRQVSEVLYIKSQQAISGWLYWLTITYIQIPAQIPSSWDFRTNTVNRHFTLPCIKVWVEVECDFREFTNCFVITVTTTNRYRSTTTRPKVYQILIAQIPLDTRFMVIGPTQ